MIYVITHKTFDDSILPQDGYRVLYVGAGEDAKENYIRDNTGDNISEKNKSYCELTGMYWIWKNAEETPDDTVGIVHYRRFFTEKEEDREYMRTGVMPRPLDYEVCEYATDDRSVLVPEKLMSVFNVYGVYRNTHDRSDIFKLRSILMSKYPEYVDALDETMNSHYGYYYNMFACKKRYFDEYCEWLFDVMSELEKRIDVTDRVDDYQKRVIGFISERLLKVWFETQGFDFVEYPVFNTEVKTRSTVESAVYRVGCYRDYLKKKYDIK